MVPETFQQLGLALLLGLLVGMQRERAESRLAGFRTFPLVTLLGALSGLLAQSFGPWIVAAGVLAVVVTTAMGNVHKIRQGELEPGMTTEIALLVMYGVGAHLTVGPYIVAISVAGTVAVLLHLKEQLHGLAHRLEEGDMRAIMQFVLIAFIVLPIVPNRVFGPYEVINPSDIWRMVVLIVGISLGGYLVYRFFGARAGALFGGILGGIISSTATTVGFARRSKDQPDSADAGALVIMIASTVVYLRLLIEIQVVAPGFLPIAAPRILVVMAVSALLCFVWWRPRRARRKRCPNRRRPRS